MAQSAQIAEVRPWHEMLVDFELQHPGASLSDMADFFGKTVTWICVVRRSDAFQEYRAKRIGFHQSLVSASVIDKAEAIAHISMDAMLDKLERERDELSLDNLKQTAEMALRALGINNQKGPTFVQQNNFSFNASEAELREAQDKLREVKAKNSQLIEGEKVVSLEGPEVEGT